MKTDPVIRADLKKMDIGTNRYLIWLLLLSIILLVTVTVSRVLMMVSGCRRC